MFYDKILASPRNIFRMALRLQNFMAEDPINGDFKMQEYLHPVMASASLIWASGDYKAQVPLNFSKPSNGYSSVQFLTEYKSLTSLADVHLQEWKVCYVPFTSFSSTQLLMLACSRMSVHLSIVQYVCTCTVLNHRIHHPQSYYRSSHLSYYYLTVAVTVTVTIYAENM